MSPTLLKTIRCKNKSGEERIILIYQEWIDARTHDDPDGVLEGLKSITTPEGYHVNSIDSETFEILETNETVRVG
jgi:hypothetical protein